MKRFWIYLGLCSISLVLMFPFYWVVVSSLKSVAGMNLEPPAMYPAEQAVSSVRLPTASRWFEAEHSTWFLLLRSKNLVAKTAAEGGYYVQVKDEKPSKLVNWYSDSEVKAVQPSRKELAFENVPVNLVKGSERVVLAKMARQKEGGFNEILFCTEAGGAQTQVSALLNVVHSDVRFAKAQWSNFGKALAGPEASIGGKSSGFLLFMRNSFFISIMAVVGQILSSSLVAFGFSRIQFRGRELLFVVLLATLMVPGQVTLIPLFYIYKSLGWIDSFLPLIVPHFTAGAFNVFLVRQLMLGIPRELDESAEIDGASKWTIYRKIILPNCKPILIVVGLFTFVSTWQDVMGPLIYLDNPNSRTVSLGLEYFRSPYVDNRPLLMAGALLSMIPVAIIFLFAQRYILAGIATTGMKG